MMRLKFSGTFSGTSSRPSITFATNTSKELTQLPLLSVAWLRCTNFDYFALAFGRTGRSFKSDPPAVAGRRRHKVVDGFNQALNVGVVALETLFKFGQFEPNLLICSQHFAHSRESANYKDAHLDCSFRIQHRRSHDGAVFREGIRQIASSAIVGT